MPKMSEGEEEILMHCLSETNAELVWATEQFGHHASLHEAWAVIHEEMEELFEVVRWKNKTREQEQKRLKHAFDESKQVAAMALKTMMFCMMKQAELELDLEDEEDEGVGLHLPPEAPYPTDEELNEGYGVLGPYPPRLMKNLGDEL